MPGPQPKHPGTRARRNKSSTARQLASEVSTDAPVLPPLGGDHQWHPMTLLWWQDVWASPMAREYVTADAHGLYRLAMLVEDFWRHPSKDMASEIRLQEQRYGLTPLDRRRLEWTIETAAEAKDRGAKRRSGQPKPNPAPPATGVVDPRAAIHLVN